jgi:hypothetical protein
MIILKADDWDTRGETFRSHVYICKANNVDFLCLPLPCALRWVCSPKVSSVQVPVSKGLPGDRL